MKEREKEKVPVRKGGEVVSWRPSDIFAEMDRLFEEFKSSFERLFWPERRWTWPIKLPGIALPQVRAPFCDLIDTGREYQVCAEMPGIPKDKIDINIDERGVEISAEARTGAEEKRRGYVSREREYSRFYRTISFPEEVLPEKAEATYTDGILEVRVPKKRPTEVKRHKVKVK